MRKFIKSLLAITLFFSATLTFAQTSTVSGTVADATNVPLIGVSVMVKGTTIGDVTNTDGKYSLQQVPANAILVFSYVGYLPQEITVGNKGTIDVALKEDTKNLNEVVVVGYGVQKKETVTGAVSSVKGQDLALTPTANLSNAIAGRLSGVITFQRSGEPGYDGTTIRIRGSNTLGNNDPLVVIDGVAARAGGLERLNPNEIESMSVLKDASAAIYGARAANGVILITTKKGQQSSKPELTYTFNQGWGRPGILPKMSNAAEYAELRNELITNAAMVNPNMGTTPTDLTLWKTPEEIQKYRDGSDPWRYPNTNWIKETYADWSPQSIHNATLEGGSERFNYFASFGYTYQDGYWRNSANNYKQYDLRINLDGKINDYMKLSLGMMGRQENRNFPSQSAGDILWFTARGRPTDHAYWPNGLPGPAQEYGRNPVVAASNETGYDRDKRYYIQTNATLEISQPWIDGLKLNLTMSYDKYLQQRKLWFQPWYLYNWDGTTVDANNIPVLTKALSYPSTPDPKLNMYSDDQTNMVTGAILHYDRKFGNHGISFLAGTEKDQSDDSYFDAFRRYFLSTSVQEFSAGGDLEKSNGSGDWTKNWIRARMNYFGRIAYNYQEKYLLEFNWREDASYMFPKDTRYGFFPGFLLGYRISEENFWKEHFSFIDYLKIRGSWGQLGNDQVWYKDKLQEYQYLASYYYEWGYIIDNKDVKGLRISRFQNPNITWERASNTNIGIEMRTLKNRLYLEADYFYNRRSGVLYPRNASVPQTAGLTLPAENIGKVDNTGFDFKLEWNDAIGRDFIYRISVTGGYAKNKIVFWDEAAGAPDWQKSTGHPMGTNLYYIYDGVFKDWNEINDTKNRPNYDGITNDSKLVPGDMKFKDVDGDKKITPDDQVRMDKTNEPKWVYGINGAAQWKSFDLNFLLQGAADSWRKVYFDSGDIGNYPQWIYDHHWSVDNPSDKYPRVHERALYYWDGTTAGNNTFWMQNTRYLRLKNIEIGYTLPKHIVDKTQFFSYFRVFANAQNILTFTPCRDIDPETSADNGTSIPMPKIINFGFSVKF
jgi:TonB-linked SusC/RagA family outer membrane protein